MEAFQAIEGLPVVRLLKASYLAYPLISAAHIAAIGTLLTSVALMDLRLIGAITSFPETPYVALLRRLALSAFTVAVATGLLMFSVRASHYAQLPVFLAKMALIGLARHELPAVFVVVRARCPWHAAARWRLAGALDSRAAVRSIHRLCLSALPSSNRYICSATAILVLIAN